MSGTVTEAWGDSGEFEFVAALGRRAEKVQFHELGIYRNGFDGTNEWAAKTQPKVLETVGCETFGHC
jgi:hypothetical protein